MTDDRALMTRNANCAGLVVEREVGTARGALHHKIAGLSPHEREISKLLGNVIAPVLVEVILELRNTDAALRKRIEILEAKNR